jgi:RNA polymerase sigma factor (sigma-70 family)
MCGPRIGPARETEADSGGERLRERLEGHCGELRRFAASRLANGVEADELAQRTLFRALQGLDSYRGGNLRAWLFAIARRLIIDRYREQLRFQFVTIEELADLDDAAGRTPPDPVQSICQARERIRHCLDCLALRLSLRQQVAVLLADVHGAGDSESAARMGMSAASFKSLLRKARRRLHAAAGHPCPLVAKSGVEQACPCSARDADERVGAAPVDGSRRTGLGDPPLAALRRELAEALGVGGTMAELARGSRGDEPRGRRAAQGAGSPGAGSGRSSQESARGN